MSDPSLALQKAIFERLTAELSCPVFDAVPSETAYPYVTMDTEINNNSDYLNKRQDNRLFYLAVWSAHQGQSEVKGIMAEIDAALHGYRPALETGAVVNIRVESKRANREPDGRTYMGRVGVRIITTH